MAERLITKANVWEDSDCVCMARVVGIDGDEITQADVSSIALKVFDEDAADPDAAVSWGSPPSPARRPRTRTGASPPARRRSHRDDSRTS